MFDKFEFVKRSQAKRIKGRSRFARQQFKRRVSQKIDGFRRKNYCIAVKVRDIIRLIERDGWYLVRTKGSHRQYRHPTKVGLVTIPGNTGGDVATGTLNNILKQAGLK